MGKHYKKNNQRLTDISDEEWISAIDKCRESVQMRIRGRTKFGVHSEINLGENAIEKYTGEAILAILEGDWEFKSKFSLSEQLIRIANSKISTIVEKTENKNNKPTSYSYLNDHQNLVDTFYLEKLEIDDLNLEEKKKMEEQFLIIESVAEKKPDFKEYFECVSEGLKPGEIAIIMEKDVKWIYKLTESFKNELRKELKRRKNGEG